MADASKIEWTDATWNPIGGCTRVSEGCRNCYAEIMAARFSDPGQWGHGLARRVTLPDGSTDHRWTDKMVLSEHKLDAPLRWKKPRRIFVNSTSDLFHEAVPDEWIDQVFGVMAIARQHTFQVLTKRPERMRRYVTDLRTGKRPIEISIQAVRGSVVRWLDVSGAVKAGLRNVWLGTSVEDQATANERIPHLLATPAAVRFVSAEPLLGPVTVFDNAEGPDPDALLLDWIIVGGESGPGARPMHPDWARDLRDQCQAAGAAFFFKQWGEWAPGENCGDVITGYRANATWWNKEWLFSETNMADPEADWDDEPDLYRVGKARAGRLLDGQEWNELPKKGRDA